MSKGLTLVLGVLAAVFACAASASAATIPGQYIVVLKNGVSEQAAESEAKKDGADVFLRYKHALNGYATRMSDAQLARVRADPRVQFVSQDSELTAVGSTCTDLTACQLLTSSIIRIGGDRSSTRSGNGRGSVNINVAVLDTGIDVDHPDLNVVGGKNCSTDQSFDDANGHGTMVAGMIAAKDDDLGIVGVAPGARLWAVRVLNDKGKGPVSSVLCGIDFVTATRTDSDPTNDIAVANESLAGKGSDDENCGRTRNDPEQLAICASVASGVTYVVAAGNESVDFQTSTPAAYDEVLTATAVTDTDGKPGGLGPQASQLPGCLLPYSDDTPAAFSNFATLPGDQAHTLAAPGVCITGTFPGGLYAFQSGTSFATPRIAGTAALCIATGHCTGTGVQVVQKLVSDAAAYNTANPDYGFTGDPLHSPDPTKYYGFLIRAGLY